MTNKDYITTCTFRIKAKNSAAKLLNYANIHGGATVRERNPRTRILTHKHGFGDAELN